LRTRLIASLVALLAVLSAIIGVASVITMRHVLTGQLDNQLVAADNRSHKAYDHPDGDHQSGDLDSGFGPNFTSAPGQAAGTIGAIRQGSTIVGANYTDSNGSAQQLPDSGDTSALTAIPADGEPHTVDLPGLGNYRVLAAADTDGDGHVLITGLPMHNVQIAVYRLSAVITVVAVVGLALAAMLGLLIVRLTLRPLRRVAATASRVAELPLDKGDVALAVRVPEKDIEPRTEVGQVGVALNRMLGHVSHALSARQQSESKVRQFVADASHELRTPLAAIRGYAELTRRSRQDLPPDISYAMERVESEATRMSGMVDDLLLLARLDAGRPVEREDVDLTALLVDVVSDAHVAGPEHPLELDLPDEPIVVSGDNHRLHQVVANLLTNARTHTPAGTHISVRLARLNENARITVADDGPGIPASLLPSVFDRFARGDDSRSRAAGSTGLGLAIVSSVVAAHGGSVRVESRPGRTEFTVDLPITADALSAPEMLTAGR
jgi:two-component system OmpR family sensor kinase